MTRRRSFDWLGAIALLHSGCGMADPAAGSLVVSVATRGLDPGVGYTVTIDQRRERFALNEMRELGGVPAGERMVNLVGVNPNCTSSRPGLLPVSIEPSAPGRLDYEVECRATTGAIRITVATSGEDIDEDGYVVGKVLTDAWGYGTLDSLSVAPSDTTILAPEPVEVWHQIWIGGLAPNCSLDGTALRDVLLRGEMGTRDTATVSFSVTCKGIGP